MTMIGRSQINISDIGSNREWDNYLRRANRTSPGIHTRVLPPFAESAAITPNRSSSGHSVSGVTISIHELLLRAWTDVIFDSEHDRHEILNSGSAFINYKSVVARMLAPNQLLPSFERISEMVQLPNNWDGYGAVPPTAMAVAKALTLIVSSAEETTRDIGHPIAPWTSAPIADGGLQVEWKGNRARIEVQVTPDGSYGFLAKWGRGDDVHYTENEDVALPDMVKLIVRVVYS